MVCTRVLTALVLLSLFSSGVSAEVDQNTLFRIIRFFETEYKPPGETSSGEGVQYAVAINVPAGQCGTGFNEFNNFLSEENPEKVKNDLKVNNLHKGTRLVAATPKGGGSTAIHSERALLLCGDNNQVNIPVQNLLNKYPDGCVVFYTFNSPCLKYCLNQTKDDNEENRVRIQTDRAAKNGTNKQVAPAVKKCILKSLSMLTNHSGPKAFVFNQVYRQDKDKLTELAAALREVAEKVPLYRCNTNSCIRCPNNSNDDLKNVCLS